MMDISMSNIYTGRLTKNGYSAVEFLVASVIFGILVVGITSSLISVRKSYALARQLNEIYTVLSACPEIDRALEFSALTSTSNCYPNNTFQVENGLSGSVTYTPILTVASTASLPNGDPLQGVADSKIIDISVGYPNQPQAPPLELRMLITRNGVGQQ
jgi:hypothetical protein